MVVIGYIYALSLQRPKNIRKSRFYDTSTGMWKNREVFHEYKTPKKHEDLKIIQEGGLISVSLL